jgi:hypothetical protein
VTSAAADDKLGRLAYDAYCTQLGGIADLSAWDDLDDTHQTAWIAAARTIEAHAYESANLDD